MYSKPEEGFGYVYCLLEPNTNTIRYVGQTRQSLSKRLTQHVSDAQRKKQNTHLFAWIRSLLASELRPRIQFIAKVELECLGDCEQFWIDYLKKIECDLVNTAVGGIGGPTRLGMKTPIDVLEKQNKNRYRGPHNPEVIEHLRKVANNRPIFECTECPAKIKGVSNFNQHTAKHKNNPTKIPWTQPQSRGKHTRWHTNRGKIHPECPFCKELTDLVDV